MGKSQHLRLSDIRGVYHLLCETRYRGRDRRAWRQHMLTGLLSLTGSQIGLAMEQGTGGGVSMAHASISDIGWDNTRARDHWMKHVSRDDMAQHPSGLALMKMVAIRKSFVRSRQQLVGTVDWRKSGYFNDVVLPTGRDEFVLSYCPILAADIHLAISLSRPPFAKPFDRRERTILHLFHRELCGLISGEIVAARAKSPLVQLPPRLKQTASALAAGRSEKEIAADLRLSQHTVHHHVQRLHKTMKVRSRGELISKLFTSHVLRQNDFVL